LALRQGEQIRMGNEPHLACGIYHMNGLLRINSQNQFVLIARYKTPIAWEILPVGGDMKEKFKKLDSKVSMEFYVPKEIKGNEFPLVYFQKFLPIKDFPSDSLFYIKAEACDNQSYLQLNKQPKN
jgi:hypothetical protein